MFGRDRGSGSAREGRVSGARTSRRRPNRARAAGSGFCDATGRTRTDLSLSGRRVRIRIEQSSPAATAGIR